MTNFPLIKLTPYKPPDFSKSNKIIEENEKAVT